MARFPLLAALSAALIACLLPAQQDFRRAFDQAATLRDRSAMANVVQGQKGFDGALQYGREMLEQLVTTPNPEVRNRFELLAEVVETVHKTAVLSRMRNFYDDGGAETLQELRSLAPAHNRFSASYRAGMKGNDQEAWNRAMEEAGELAPKYEALGEMLWASRCYRMMIDLLTKAKGPGKGEREYKAIEGFLRTREAWDMTRDHDFGYFRKRYEYLDDLKSQGRSLDEVPGEDQTPSKPELAYMPGSRWERVEGVFRPWEHADRGVYQMSTTFPVLWRSTYIGGFYSGLGEAGIGKIPFTPEIQMLRTKSNVYELDATGDGKPNERVRIGSRPQLTIFDRDLDGQTTKAALFFWTGSAQENMGGIPINLAPGGPPDPSALIFYRGATALEVEFLGEKLLFIDENASGTFGDAPMLMAAPRHRPHGVMIGDSMVLHGMRQPVPFSDFIPVGDGYYKIKFSGMTMLARQLDMSRTPTGRLVLEYKGPPSARPKHLIVAEVSAFVGAYFDLAASPKGVEVPAGRYQIAGGLVLSGSGARMRSASIGAGRAPVMTVGPGEEVTVTVGAPYTFEFAYEADPARVRVDGLSVKVHGTGGEVYLDPWEGIPQPDVLVRRDSKSPPRKLGSMVPPRDGETVNSYRRQKQGLGLMDAIFAPMDLLVANPLKGPVQIQLVQTRHPYFGRVESDWK